MENILNDDDYMLWRLISQTTNAIRKARERELIKFDLTRTMAAILMISEATGGQVTPYKIASWLIREPHSISNLLVRMEKAGLIEKKKQPGKKKAVHIQITDKGRQAYLEAIKLESVRKILSAVSKYQRQYLIPILRTMRDEALSQVWLKRKLPFPPY